MKHLLVPTLPPLAIALLLALAGPPAAAQGQSKFCPQQQILPKPARGGGLDADAPMIHVDLFYDAAANEMIATLDTSHGIPHLTPLPPGWIFDANSVYSVLNGKAYNFQYAWNPGGIFAPPPGAALWIECLDHSSGLETYDGPGNKTENPPRPWTPIFGTGGSSDLWQWYGRMAHNAYAIQDPPAGELYATYRVYFGDAATGAPGAFAAYDDAVVTLTFTAGCIPEPGSLAFLGLGGLLWGVRRKRNVRDASAVRP